MQGIARSSAASAPADRRRARAARVSSTEGGQLVSITRRVEAATAFSFERLSRVPPCLVEHLAQFSRSHRAFEHPSCARPVMPMRSASRGRRAMRREMVLARANPPSAISVCYASVAANMTGGRPRGSTWLSAMKRALEQDDPSVSAKARPNQGNPLIDKTQLKIKELSMSSSKSLQLFSDHVLRSRSRNLPGFFGKIIRQN